MVSKKLAGLFVIPALLGTMNTSYAISDTATQILQCTLGSYLDVTPETAGAVTETSIAPDTGNLDNALISKFKININTDSQELYLRATAATADTTNVNALFKQGSQTYIIFSNTAAEKRPTASAIADCMTGTPSAANNANAIAYPISSVELDNGGSATYDDVNNQYTINVKGGTTFATTTTGTTPYTDTYSFQDNSGIYQATVTLTSTSL